MTQKVLVTDASQRKALPIIRSLGKKSISVIAGEDTRWSMGFYSKYTQEKVVYPSPENEEQFIQWLIDSAKSGLFDILFPIDERTMQPVTKHLDKLEKHMIVPVVSYDTFMIARNKAKTMAFAKDVDVPTPITIELTEESEIATKLKEVEMPVVIKATQSSGSRGLTYVFDRSKLIKEYKKIHESYPFPIVQQLIPKGGSSFGVEVLCDRGSVLRTFAHRRIREFPVDGGPSTLRESVFKPELVEYAKKLLSAMKWHGVAMVEFIENPETNQCVLLEINPKFWGSIALPISAGVDFPYLLYKLACGKILSEDPGYEEHKLCRWFFPGDILHFIFNPKRFHLKPSFFKFRGMSYDLWDIKDIMPVIYLLCSVIKEMFNINVWKNKIFR